MTCEECGNTRHSGNNCPETHEDMNFINNNNYRPQQNQGNNFNNQQPLRELISGQAKIMEGLSRKLASNDRILENINNRMDNFSSAIKN